MNIKGFAAAALCAAALSTPAFASTVFSDRAAFNAAVANQITSTFEGVVPPGFDGTYFGTSGGNNGVGFLGSEILIQSKNSGLGFWAAPGQYGSDYLYWESDVLTAFVLSPVTAIGFDFMELFGHDAQFTVEAGGVTTIIPVGATPKFFGILADSSFDTVKITAQLNGPQQYNAWTLDNFSRNVPIEVDGGGSGVPEPATWSLMLIGFGGLGALLRRRRAAVFTPA